jgi:capsid protein
MEDRDNFKILQRFTTDHFIDPVFRRWLESAMTTGVIDIPITKYEKFANSANFIPRSWTYVNPLQEMQAQILGMQNGQTTMQDVQSNFGRDVEELMETINREKALAKQYGIETAFEPFGVQKQPVPPEIINEENNQ